MTDHWTQGTPHEKLSDESGHFKRKESAFRNFIEEGSRFAPEKDRYAASPTYEEWCTIGNAPIVQDYLADMFLTPGMTTDTCFTRTTVVPGCVNTSLDPCGISCISRLIEPLLSEL